MSYDYNLCNDFFASLLNFVKSLLSKKPQTRGLNTAILNMCVVKLTVIRTNSKTPMPALSCSIYTFSLYDPRQPLFLAAVL